MRLGIPWWIGAGSPIEGIELAGSLDVDFLEVSLDAPWPEGLSGPKLRDASQEAEIAIGFHAPWRTQALAHPRSVLSRAARSVAQECIDLALGAGAEYIVFHVDARDFARFPVEEVVDEGVERARASLRALGASAGEDLDILVENTSPPTATPEQVATFLEPLPEVGFCLDPGHAVLAKAAGVEGATGDPEAWIEHLGDRLRLLHVMDWVRVDGRIVDHLVPGAGKADLAGLLAAVSQAGCEDVLMEAFFANPDREEASTRDLAKGRDHLRSLV